MDRQMGKPVVHNSEDPSYEAMVLSCIDPRFQERVCKYAEDRGLTGKYSHFAIAGASIGVVAPRFKDWHQAFWDNLGISMELHGIAKVIVINHLECGAAVAAYGPIAGDDDERKVHRAVLVEFRAQLAKRHPQLDVETLLMDTDGKYEVIP